MAEKKQESKLPEKPFTVTNLTTDYEFLEHHGLVTEEDYDKGLAALLEHLLFEDSWRTVIKNDVKLRGTMTFVHDISMTCKGLACPYASKCSVIRNLKDAKSIQQLIGSNCRDEKLFAVRLFTDLVRDLRIAPEQTTDVLTVIELVKQYVYRRRIDWDISIIGMAESVPAVIAQKTAQVYWKREMNQLFGAMDKINKYISQLYSQLLASRKDRAALAAQIGKSASNILEKLLADDHQDPNIIELPPSDYSDEP